MQCDVLQPVPVVQGIEKCVTVGRLQGLQSERKKLAEALRPRGYKSVPTMKSVFKDKLYPWISLNVDFKAIDFPPF